MNKKQKKILIGVVIAIVVVFAIAIAILAAPLSSLKEGRIHSGIYLGPVDVSNCTEEEAKAKIDEYISEYEKGDIKFVVGQESKDYSAKELKLKCEDNEAIKKAMDIGRTGGIFERYNVLKKLEKEPLTLDLQLTYDSESVDGMLKALAKDFNSEAVDASLKREDGKFIITEGKEGIVLDEEKSKLTIEEYFKSGWNTDNKTVELQATIDQPKGTAEELAKVKDCLGSFTTYCGTGESRVTNIVNGVKRINGSIVYPGEVFSANAAMEPYDAKNGYILGGTYENGQVVQSYGGGICQVSSTLYNAALFAELEIVERANHSMLVTYVNPAMDAAIAGTWKDLKLKNNTEAPIYIEGYVKGGTVYFNIYGQETRSPSRKISFRSETLSSSEPGTTIVPVNQPVGYFAQTSSGHTALTAKLWKTVTENGKSETTEVNFSSYSSSPAVYEIGVDGASGDQMAAINAAIEAGSAEAAQAAAGASAPAPAPEAPTQDESVTPASPDAQQTPAGAGDTPAGNNTPTGNNTPAGQ